MNETDDKLLELQSAHFFRPSRLRDFNFQFWSMSAVLFSDSFCYSMIFTFVTFFVEDLGIDAKEVGWYSGYLASAHYLGQVISCFLWGHLSDSYGRKPFILLGSLATTLSIGLLGVSVRFWQALLARFLGGFFNSNWPMCKNYVNDVSTRDNRTLALSSISLMFGLGSIMGPFIGGVLSKLTPRLPYLLPCGVGALLALGAGVLTFIYLPEPYKPKPKLACGIALESDDEDEEEDDDAQTAGIVMEIQEQAELQLPDSLRREAEEANKEVAITEAAKEEAPVLMSEEIIRSIALFGSFSVVDISMNEVFPAWAMLSVMENGIDFDTADLGILWAISGVSLLIFQKWCFVPICDRLGTRRTFQMGCLLGMTWAFTPLAHGLDAFGRWAVWALIILFTIAKTVHSTVGWSALNLQLNLSAPPGRIGYINGIAATAAGAARTGGPFIATLIFAWSVGNGMSFPFDYWLIFLVVLVLICLNVLQAAFLTNLGVKE